MSSVSVTEIETSIAANNSVPEFLYQLTKMLTDDHRDIIEWSNGKYTDTRLGYGESMNFQKKILEVMNISLF